MKYPTCKDELGKLTVIQGAVEGVYTVKEVARRLHLSGRRIKRQKKQFREQGEVIHGNAGKQGAGSETPSTALLTTRPDG